MWTSSEENRWMGSCCNFWLLYKPVCQSLEDNCIFSYLSHLYSNLVLDNICLKLSYPALQLTKFVDYEQAKLTMLSTAGQQVMIIPAVDAYGNIATSDVGLSVNLAFRSQLGTSSANARRLQQTSAPPPPPSYDQSFTGMDACIQK